MDKENLKNQALLEEFRQSWEHFRHIENQRWKILTIFGSLCSIYIGVIYYLYLSQGGPLGFFGETQTLSSYGIVLLSLFFQAAVFIIMLILLKLRYEFCLYLRDLYIKRKNFSFTLSDSIFADTELPELFKADSIHWMTLGAFLVMLIVSVIPPLVIFWDVKTGLTLFLGYITSFVFLGFSIGIMGRGVVDFKTRGKVREFFKQCKEKIPMLIPFLLPLSVFLVLGIYVLCEKEIVLFLSLLPFLLLAIFIGIFVYRWLIYVGDLEEKDEKIETIDVLADKELMEKISIAEEQVERGEIRSLDDFLKEVTL